jgi:GntR family transcriptional repressor for pyruvate dehydrogenase complex
MEEKVLQQKSYIKVIDYIKSQIKVGKLELGERLPAERELSNQLGVSRNSVREAIRTLDIMGIISSQQGAGNYLIGNFEYNLVETMSMMFLLNQIDYHQISQLRRALELQSIMLAIDNITEEEIDHLMKITTQLEHETEEINVILDKQLHYNIAKASHNTLFISILQALSELVDQFIVDMRRDILSSEDSRVILNEAHDEMMRSLITKDKLLAFQAISKHFDIVDKKLNENGLLLTNNRS